MMQQSATLLPAQKFQITIINELSITTCNMLFVSQRFKVLQLYLFTNFCSLALSTHPTSSQIQSPSPLWPRVQDDLEATKNLFESPAFTVLMSGAQILSKLDTESQVQFISVLKIISNFELLYKRDHRDIFQERHFGLSVVNLQGRENVLAWFKRHPSPSLLLLRAIVSCTNFS